MNNMEQAEYNKKERFGVEGFTAEDLYGMQFSKR